MGYTHYWQSTDSPVPAEAFGRLAMDCKGIIFPAAAERKIALGDASGNGKPLVSEGAIEFNGWAEDDDAYETFGLSASGLRRFDFTKTAERPYDLIVCVVLLRAVHHYGASIGVSSDGSWDGEWIPARKLYAQLFGADPVCPWLS